MAVNNNINVIVSAIDKATAPLKKIGGSFSSLNNTLKKNSENFKKMAGYGTVALTGIGLGIKSLVSQASDLEETTQKFGVVYSNLSEEANKASKDIAESYGLSQKASKQFLADLGDMTSGFGLSQEASLEYAKSVTTLGVDLASFSNIAGGSEEAIDRLNKGLLGEHENLKALGIVINENILKKQLLSDGTSEFTGLALEEAKIQARYKIALSQSKNAIGDFERSKKSLANQTRILKAKMEDLTTNLGKAFLPIITKVVNAIAPIIEKFSIWANQNQELVKNIVLITGAIVGIGTVLAGLGLIIPPIIAGFSALGAAFAVLTGPIGLVIAGIAAFGTAYKKNFLGFADIVDGVVEKIKPILNDIIISIKLVYEGVAEWLDRIRVPFMEFVNFIQPYVETFLSILFELFGNTFDNISTVISGVWDVIKGVFQVAIGIISGMIEIWLNIFSGNWKEAWEGVKNMFELVWEGIKNILSGVLQIIKGIISQALDIILAIIKGAWETIKILTNLVWEGVKATIKGVWEGIKFIVISFTNGIWITIKTIFNSIKDSIISIMNGISMFFTSIWETIKGTFSGTVESIYENTVGRFTDLMGVVKGIYDKVKNWFKGILGMKSKGDKIRASSNATSGARATGGTVMGNNTYLVGEKGPELFTPSTTGSITPNNQLQNSNPGNININLGGVVVNNSADENRLVEKIKNELTRTLQLQKMGIS